jgi:mono/diheme cytochrome c family protein
MKRPVKITLILVVVFMALGCLHFMFSHRDHLDPPEKYAGLSSLESGAKTFQDLCLRCHAPGGKGGGFMNIMNTEATFTDGKKAIRDAAYIKESITDPSKLIVADRKGKMPSGFTKTFKGRDKELDDVVTYIISLTESKTEEPAKK